MEAMGSEFGYHSAPPPPPLPPSNKNPDNFAVEDLLDFSHDDGASDQLATADSLSSTPVGTSHSSDYNHPHHHLTSPSHFSDSHFTGDLCLPYEDSAELEWLSNFVEESFSTEDIQKLQLISGMSALKTRPDDHSEPRYYPLAPTRPANSPTSSPAFSSEQPVPGKARSKRSRAAPGNWASCLRLLNPAQPESTPGPARTATSKKKGGSGSGCGSGSGMGSGPEPAGAGEVRRCLHCATDKTPQWRTGPMGPKTLCNACGVRYKSGRLVPEYRPAASPTFVLTKHSNSHRKVMELRRQKELQQQQQLQQYQHHHHHQQQLIHNPNGMMFDPNNSNDYLIHQHIGPDFRQLI